MNEQERMRLAQEGQIMEEKLKYLGRELEKLTMILVELEKAKGSLEGVEGGKESLINIGGDILIEAEVKSSKVIYPIGAGYYHKMDKTKAKERIEDAIKSIGETHKKIKEEVKKIEGELVNLLRRMR